MKSEFDDLHVKSPFGLLHDLRYMSVTPLPAIGRTFRPRTDVSMKGRCGGLNSGSTTEKPVVVRQQVSTCPPPLPP